MRYVIGLDIGGTKLSVSLGYADNDCIKIKQKKILSTPQGNYHCALENMADIAKDLIHEEGIKNEDVAGIGISSGGPLDSKKGIILSPPNLIGWDKVRIVDYYNTKLGIPTYLQNDANACAIAEWKYGSGRGTQNMIFLTFGTGVGAGLILNGALYSGTNDMAGEIGHCRAPAFDGAFYSPVGHGKASSFEGFCSGAGIAELGRTMALEKFQQGEKPGFCSTVEELNNLSARHIAKAADEGDKLAQFVYRCSGRYLGGMLSLLIDLLNPEVIVIGSVYTHSAHLLEESMREVMDIESLTRSRAVCEIKRAALGNELGDIAAMSIVP